MERKPFSIGARIEHLQTMIDAAQYGRYAGRAELGAADYKLAVHLANGRSAYTFACVRAAKWWLRLRNRGG